MRFAAYIVAAAISLGMWAVSYKAAEASYHLAQTSYRQAQMTGLMPNLHIRARLMSVMD